MKLGVRVHGKVYHVQLDRHAGEAKIGDNFFLFAKKGGLLFVNDKPVSYECVRDADGSPRGIHLRGKFISVEMEQSGKQEARGGQYGGEVHAPLNGQVVKIIVAEGEYVKQGSVILVLEAMKMENEIAAPFEGTVKTLHIAEKQVVKAGDLLFLIEPLSSLHH